MIVSSSALEDTHIVTIWTIKVPGLNKIDMWIGDDSRVPESIRGVGVREKTVCDKDVALFRFDLSELPRFLAMLVQNLVGIWRIEAFRMIVENFTDASYAIFAKYRSTSVRKHIGEAEDDGQRVSRRIEKVSVPAISLISSVSTSNLAAAVQLTNHCRYATLVSFCDL